MNQDTGIFSTLPLGLIGLVLGWTVVLRCSRGIRPLITLSVVICCLISLRIVAALFETSWWVGLSGLLLGVTLHAGLLSMLQPIKSNP